MFQATIANKHSNSTEGTYKNKLQQSRFYRGTLNYVMSLEVKHFFFKTFGF